MGSTRRGVSVKIKVQSNLSLVILWGNSKIVLKIRYLLSSRRLALKISFLATKKFTIVTQYAGRILDKIGKPVKEIKKG